MRALATITGMHTHAIDDHDGDDQETLDRFLTLCLTIYERMEREGSWPWGDSQEFGDVVESDSKQNAV